MEDKTIFKVLVIECPHCHKPIEVKIPKPPQPKPNQEMVEIFLEEDSEDEWSFFKKLKD